MIFKVQVWQLKWEESQLLAREKEPRETPILVVIWISNTEKMLSFPSPALYDGKGSN